MYSIFTVTKRGLPQTYHLMYALIACNLVASLGGACASDVRAPTQLIWSKRQLINVTFISIIVE